MERIYGIPPLMSLCKRISYGRLLSPVPWDRVVTAPRRIACPPVRVLVDVKDDVPPGSAPSNARHAFFAVQVWNPARKPEQLMPQ